MKTTVLGLATFLLVSLFFVNATTSVSNLAVGEYDPWADLDGDGDIDIYDIVDIAGKYSTAGDPTRNVTVTNWLPPAPKTVLYHSWEFSWHDNVPGMLLPPPIFVGEYTQMSVLLGFDKVNVEYGDVFWTVDIQWMDINSTYDADVCYRLSSTLGRVSRFGHGSQIMTDSYAIEAPYVRLNPAIMNAFDKYKGNATVSIYLQLSHAIPMSSGAKTTWWDVERSTNSVEETFGYYKFMGYGNAIGTYDQMTIHVWTNVSCTVYLEDTTFSLIDSFSKGYGWTRRVYEMTFPSIRIRIVSQTQPWYASIRFYLTT